MNYKILYFATAGVVFVDKNQYTKMKNYTNKT